MADNVVVSIDYGRISRIVENAVGSVERKVEIVAGQVEDVRRETMEEIDKVKKQLAEFMRQSKMQAALQRAISETVRVRQELETKFGTQKLVRDNMLGILQATDLGLITESTISRCTEELMISAPKYWLAPCLIALAGWITNNESLAKRAITEACKRDREKTCLLFALITRRVNAGRIQSGKKPTETAFEWLSEYFKLQNPEKMKTSIIAYIDAYTNGVFGEDRDNLCREHIYHWMDVLKQRKPEFVNEQIAYWENVFSAYCSSDSLMQFNELKMICPQFDSMAGYLTRIDASERDSGIKSYLGGIMEKIVDTQELITKIDEQLVNLVSLYEEDEEDLRAEERLFQKIKDFEGDEERARRVIAAEKARKYDAPVDFAQRLSHSIVGSDASDSAKKTAIMLLKPYISSAFTKFMQDNKEAYPENVDLIIRDKGREIKSTVAKEKGTQNFVTVAQAKTVDWHHQTENAENRDELVETLKQDIHTAKAAALATVSDEAANKTKKTGTIVTCFGILIVPLFIGLKMRSKGKKMLKENEEARKEIERYYGELETKRVELLNKALDERVEANNVVAMFQSDENNEAITL